MAEAIEKGAAHWCAANLSGGHEGWSEIGIERTPFPRAATSSGHVFMGSTASISRVEGEEMNSMNQQQPALYRATLVDTRDYEITSVPPFVAYGDGQAKLMAWALASANNAGLDAGVVEYYDIIVERLGSVRPKRDQD